MDKGISLKNALKLLKAILKLCASTGKALWGMKGGISDTSTQHEFSFQATILNEGKNVENFKTSFQSILDMKIKEFGIEYYNSDFVVSMKSDKFVILEITFFVNKTKEETQRKEIAPLSDLKSRVKDLL
jgi:hypothetical protein